MIAFARGSVVACPFAAQSSRHFAALSCRPITQFHESSRKSDMQVRCADVLRWCRGKGQSTDPETVSSPVPCYALRTMKTLEHWLQVTVCINRVTHNPASTHFQRFAVMFLSLARARAVR